MTWYTWLNLKGDSSMVSRRVASVVGVEDGRADAFVDELVASIAEGALAKGVAGGLEVSVREECLRRRGVEETYSCRGGSNSSPCFKLFGSMPSSASMAGSRFPKA